MTEKAFMSDETHATLDQAIAAARAGRRDEAAGMLRQLVAANPFNADAWVWLGGLASDPREQRSALEQALAITPDNQRAQQGLAWLRQTRPEIFTTPTETRPAQQRTTPSYEERTTSSYEEQARQSAVDSGWQNRAAVYETQDQSNARTYEVPAQSRTYDAPTQAVPTYQAQTTAAPMQPVQQTDRMSAFTPLNTATIDHGRTDRMATVPPPAVAPATQVTYRRSPFAGFARWLVLLTWIFSFGAVATFAALIWAFPGSFESALRPILAIFNLRLVEADIATTRFGTAITLTVLAVVDLMIILGMLFRSRWSWGINALLATLVLLGSGALFGLAYAGLTPFTASGFAFNRLPEQILTGLLAFSVLFFIVSLGSRRAFFRRRVEQHA
jgi:tetratricopeptide (TPR) repeat protein